MRNIYILTIISFLSFCGCNNRNADIVFLYVDPLEKILPEQNIFMPAEGHSDVAKGEHATYQFVVRSNYNIDGLTAQLHSFKDTLLNKVLPLDKAKISFVGNVHVGRAQMSPAKDILVSASNFYPDPLLDDQEVSVGANINSLIWVSIPIDKNTQAGYYKGEISISGKVNGNNFERTLPISMKVYNTLADQQTLMLTNWYQPGFSFPDEKDIPQFSDRWWELMEQMAGYMKEYRQNVVLISPLSLSEYTFDTKGTVTSIDFDRFDKVVNFFLKKGILKRIAGGHIAGRIGGWESEFGYLVPIPAEKGSTTTHLNCHDEKAKAFYRLFFAELKKHLKTKGWEDMYMQHIADEPTPENKESYIAISSFIRNIAPEYKLIDACHTKDLDNQIDVWVPQLNYLHKDIDFYKAQQAKGKEVWYYTCVWPQGEYANRYVQQPLIKTRLLHWINYKYGINGYLHWGLNFWRGHDPMVEVAAIQPDGLVLPGGDAWVIYPYKNHLIPSIRLDAMRDGIVDYELLRMLEQKDKDKAMELTNKLIYDFNKYDTEVCHFRSIRKQLLEALEAVN